MIKFVNAKINLGLQIVRRRDDGYHDLQTIFYPIGLHAGTPSNPVEFCDVLEITPLQAIGKSDNGIFADKPAGCFEFHSDSPYPEEQNLVYKAARMFYDRFPDAPSMSIRLDKHIPDGAGIGGGSADASFTLRMLNDACATPTDYDMIGCGKPATDDELLEMSLCLGADCPFFMINRPAYAEGVGEKLQRVDLDLKGYWLLLVRPQVRISTKEAFAGVTPRKPTFDLRGLHCFSVDTWKYLVHNDFELSIFPRYPELAAIRRALYDTSAIYASLTGSGSCLYGIYADNATAQSAAEVLKQLTTIQTTYLLQL